MGQTIGFLVGYPGTLLLLWPESALAWIVWLVIIGPTGGAIGALVGHGIERLVSR